MVELVGLRLSNASKGVIALFMLSLCAAICQSQYEPYEEIQFTQIVPCQGLDEKGMPIAATKATIAEADPLVLCLYIDTRSKITFSIDLHGQHFYESAVATVDRSGWLAVQVDHEEIDLLPGEYRAKVYVGRTLKATETLHFNEQE